MSAIVACGPSPASLAEESKVLHKSLEVAATRADSDSIYREIAYIESEARKLFTKAELREYLKLAHSEN